MRIMGIDLGTKRIGVAVSDESGTIAQGRGVILRKSDEAAVKEVSEAARDGDVSRIVVGLPVNMDGTEGPRASDSRRFAERLRKASGISVELWDERMSTAEAEKVMLEADISRGKRKKNIDKLAAQLILQGYLDRKTSEESQ